jgi:hypothetical protein
VVLIENVEHIMNRRGQSILALAIVALTFGLANAGLAVDLDPNAVAIMTPDQFKWRDPTDQVAINQTILYGDPRRPGLYIIINKSKPGVVGNPHYHANERFQTVVDGVAWRGTGPVVDAAQTKRVPKGSFWTDHATKVHWDLTKEEGVASLVTGMGPVTTTEVPKSNGPWSGGDPSASTIMLPDEIQWIDNGSHSIAALHGYANQPGLFVEMLTLRKGFSFTPPHIHPTTLYTYVMSGTWWIGTGAKYDPASLTVPLKAGTFVTHFANGVHWDGAKDEDVQLLIIGEGPVVSMRVQEGR